MPRRPATITQSDIRRIIRAAKQEGADAALIADARQTIFDPLPRWNMSGSVVYFLSTGGHNVKIGFSTNLPERLKAFQTALCGLPTLMGTLAGGRKEEARLH